MIRSYDNSKHRNNGKKYNRKFKSVACLILVVQKRTLSTTFNLTHRFGSSPQFLHNAFSNSIKRVKHLRANWFESMKLEQLKCCDMLYCSK